MSLGTWTASMIPSFQAPQRACRKDGAFDGMAFRKSSRAWPVERNARGALHSFCFGASFLRWSVAFCWMSSSFLRFWWILAFLSLCGGWHFAYKTDYVLFATVSWWHSYLFFCSLTGWCFVEVGMMRDFLQWHALGSGFVPDVVKKISRWSVTTCTLNCKESPTLSDS